MYITKKIKNTINEVIEILTGKCQFRNECNGYVFSNVTCNKEAGPYCGKYRQYNDA